MLLHKNRLGLLACMAVLVGGVAQADPYARSPQGPGPAQPQTCPMIYAPVCAQRGGLRKTFGNACQAQADNYRVISRGQCGAKPGADWSGQGVGPARPPQQAQRPGRGRVCTREYRPVCAQRGAERRTFPNSCTAESAGYRIISNRQCR